MKNPFDIWTLETVDGAVLGLCPLPGRTGALDRDVEKIAAWDPGLVVSLTEPEENKQAGVSDLAGAFDRSGIACCNFAVRDFDVPGPAQQVDWDALADRVHAVLDAGGRVLFHCHGGRGRSGMALLRILVERGENPEAALSRLRAVRPGAVETPAQLAWARAPAGIDG
ncbi:MAG: protein phosphatase [Pseudomonadota bacterium]